MVHKCLIETPDGVFALVGSKGVLAPTEACNQNRQNEAFADWVAGEVISKQIKEGGGCKSGVLPATPDQPRSSGGRVIKIPPGWEYLIHEIDSACAEPPASPSDAMQEHPRWTDRVDTGHARLQAPIPQEIAADPLNLQKRNDILVFNQDNLVTRGFVPRIAQSFVGAGGKQKLNGLEYQLFQENAWPSCLLQRLFPTVQLV